MDKQVYRCTEIQMYKFTDVLMHGRTKNTALYATGPRKVSVATSSKDEKKDEKERGQKGRKKRKRKKLKKRERN